MNFCVHQKFVPLAFFQDIEDLMNGFVKKPCYWWFCCLSFRLFLVPGDQQKSHFRGGTSLYIPVCGKCANVLFNSGMKGMWCGNRLHILRVPQYAIIFGLGTGSDVCKYVRFLYEYTIWQYTRESTNQKIKDGRKLQNGVFDKIMNIQSIKTILKIL